MDAPLPLSLNLDLEVIEQAYRDNPEAFQQWLGFMVVKYPNSPLLSAWQNRLGKKIESRKQVSNLLLYTVFISTIAWAIAKIPAFISVDEEWFYPRFIPLLVIGSLITYFNINNTFNRRLALLSGAGLLGVFLVLLMMPNRQTSDSIIMALLHMPLVLLSLLGVVFGGGLWRDITGRLRFIRYGGELIIYSALVLLGGGLLTGLSIGLFQLIDIPIEEWWASYVIVWGLMSAPLIATWLWDQVMLRESKLASVIANVFSPLFLLMTVGYLFALLGEQRSPFDDREFLIIFNALLLVVWGITVFSVTGRGEQASKLLDLTTMSLVFVTLVIDAIALAAIVYRIMEFGITPNRMAVSGANLLIFIHLIWIFYEYVRTFRNSSSVDVINTTIARYLPVYTVWSVIVVVLLPLLFGFR